MSDFKCRKKNYLNEANISAFAQKSGWNIVVELVMPIVMNWTDINRILRETSAILPVRFCFVWCIVVSWRNKEKNVIQQNSWAWLAAR